MAAETPTSFTEPIQFSPGVLQTNRWSKQYPSTYSTHALSEPYDKRLFYARLYIGPSDQLYTSVQRFLVFAENVPPVVLNYNYNRIDDSIRTLDPPIVRTTADIILPVANNSLITSVSAYYVRQNKKTFFDELLEKPGDFAQSAATDNMGLYACITSAAVSKFVHRFSEIAQVIAGENDWRKNYFFVATTNGITRLICADGTGNLFLNKDISDEVSAQELGLTVHTVREGEVSYAMIELNEDTFEIVVPSKPCTIKNMGENVLTGNAMIPTEISHNGKMIFTS